MPTGTITEQIAKFDTIIMQTLFECLTPSDAEKPSMKADRERRAEKLAALPIRNGGFGLTKLITKAPAAFINTVYAAQAHPTTTGIIQSLESEIQVAYEMICQSVKVQSITEGHPLATVLPPTPEEIADGSFFRSRFNCYPHLRVQKAIVDMTLAHMWKELRDEAALLAHGDNVEQSDAIHILAATSRSQATRVLQIDLADIKCSVPRILFVTWARWWLGLPKIIRIKPITTHVGEHYSASMCEIHKTANEHAGNHAASCSLAHGDRIRAHNEIVRTILNMANEAGLTTRQEVPVHHCLTGMTPKQAAREFPDLSTTFLKQRHEEISRLEEHLQADSYQGRPLIARMQTGLSSERGSTPSWTRSWRSLKD